VDPCDRPLRRLQQQVGQLHGFAKVQWFEHVFGVHVAVAQVEAQLNVSWPRHR